MAEINDLSVTDASNTGRFPENQLPSTVNDGARALEGLIARWHKDTNGSVTSSGSSNAYVVAANQTLSAYYNGLDITFQANHTNSGASTLNVDGLGAVAIEKAGSVALTGGEIQSGSKYRVIHDGTNFIILDPTPVAASATVSGIVELATNAEANTGTDTVRALTPANLGQAISGQTALTAPAIDDSALVYDLSATANRSITLANLFKVINGLTEDTSPANSTDFLLSYDTSASDVKKVKPSNLFTAAAASQAQMETGTATDVYSTPGRQHFHPGHPKLWATFEQDGTHSGSGYNVSSYTDVGTGITQIAPTVAFSSASYATIGWARGSATVPSVLICSGANGGTKSTTAFDISVVDVNQVVRDTSEANVTAFGDL